MFGVFCPQLCDIFIFRAMVCYVTLFCPVGSKSCAWRCSLLTSSYSIASDLLQEKMHPGNVHGKSVLGAFFNVLFSCVAPPASHTVRRSGG